METNFYKERKKRIIKAAILLLIILIVFASFSVLYFHSSEKTKSLLGITAGCIIVLSAIVEPIKVGLKNLKTEKLIISTLWLLNGLLVTYNGIHKLLMLL